MQGNSRCEIRKENEELGIKLMNLSEKEKGGERYEVKLEYD